MSVPSTPSSAKLYSPRLLALSATLADVPFDDTLPLVSDARSRSCGSVIKLGLASDDKGAVTRIGMRVSACAVGQSSAAILAGGIKGVDLLRLQQVVDQIEAWLNGNGAIPAWPEFDALAAAQAHPGRHEALLLPWKAATMALSSRRAKG